MSYLRTFVLSFAFVLRGTMTWCLAITAVAVPLIYQSNLEPKHGARSEEELAAQNAAAVAFDRWEREGRLHTVAGSDPLMDLNISRRDWLRLSPTVRTAVRRRIGWGAVRGVKIERYLIHDGEVVLARSHDKD